MTDSEEKPVDLMEAMKQGRNKDGLNRLDVPEDRAEKKRGKPPYSYISLIVMAIFESPNRRQTLSGIIENIQKRFSYYGENCPAKGWKNSIRHNLSLNDCFEKTCRDPANPSKGHLWQLHPRSTHMFEGGSFMRRKKRFRKELDDKREERSLPPYGNFDSGKQQERYRTPQSDIRMTSLRPVGLTACGDVTTPEVMTTSDVTLLPYSILPDGFSQEYPLQQQDFKMQNTSDLDCVQSITCGGGTQGSLFPPSSRSSICLICAGCTCFY